MLVCCRQGGTEDPGDKKKITKSIKKKNKNAFFFLFEGHINSGGAQRNVVSSLPVYLSNEGIVEILPPLLRQEQQELAN